MSKWKHCEKERMRKAQHHHQKVLATVKKIRRKTLQLRAEPTITVPDGFKDDDEIVNEFQSLWYKIPDETWLMNEGTSYSFGDGASLLPGKTPTPNVLKTS
jgi:hypothetical protein